MVRRPVVSIPLCPRCFVQVPHYHYSKSWWSVVDSHWWLNHKQQGLGATLYIIRNNTLKIAGFFSAKLRRPQVTWLPCEIEDLAIASTIKFFSPFIIQSKTNTCILTDSKPCVQAYEKLCRGEFSASPRVLTFLSVVSRYQVSVRYICGVANMPSDHASRNVPDCNKPNCQVCSYVQRIEESVIRQINVQDVISGKVCLPFTSRCSWLSIQSECADMRRTHAHLRQGTRPSKKLTNVRDVKRYLQIASVAKDGLLIIKQVEPLANPKEWIIVPRSAIDGLVCALHIQLDHPSEHQLKTTINRYLYALDIDKVIQRITEGCHTCAALRNTPATVIEQSTSSPLESPGLMFAADIVKREHQLILVLRECVTSFTRTCIITSERHEDLRDAFLAMSVELCPLDGPNAIIRTDCAPGFAALCNVELLSKHHVNIELGRAKNKNKNPVAEKAVRELEDELLKLDLRGQQVSTRNLAIATARLNSRIRSRGLSAREMWFQRDQFTNCQIPLNDQDLILKQFEQRSTNHASSEKSKAPRCRKGPQNVIDIGDLVLLHGDRDKHKGRDRYLVVAKDGEWCNIKKFCGSQLRKNAYRVKQFFKVPCHLSSTTLEPLNKSDNDSSDEERNTTSVWTDPENKDCIPRVDDYLSLPS